MEHIWLRILAAALVMALLAFEHYAPWERWIGKKLHVTAAYCLGVLAVIIPLSVVFVGDGSREAALLLWGAFVIGGLMVCGLYLVDGLIEHRQASRERGEQIDLLTGRRHDSDDC